MTGLGTYRDKTTTLLPVLIRAIKSTSGAPTYTSGLAYTDLHKPGIRVVKVNDASLATDVKGNVGKGSWDQIIATMQLRAAHNAHDNFAAQKALVKLYGLNPNHLSPQIAYDESAMFSIAAQFSKSMRSCRMVLWLNLERDRLEPGILCADLKSALFVRAALNDLRACSCCDKPFMPHRPDQQYCSITCRERFRKRRLRAKSKEEDNDVTV